MDGKIRKAIQQSDSFEQLSEELMRVETKNQPNSIVDTRLVNNLLYVEVKLYKSDLKDKNTSNEILASALNVLRENCPTIDIDSLKIELCNVVPRSNIVRLRVIRPLEKQ